MDKAPSPSNLWLAYLAKGGSMKELRGLDNTQLEAMYKVAYGRYSSGLYDDSLMVFRHLCLLDHRNYQYFLGLGVTQSKLQQYTQAVATLSYAGRLDKADPRADVAMAGCFIELKKGNLAKQVLATAIAKAEKSEHWKQELKKARQLMAFVSSSTGRS